MALTAAEISYAKRLLAKSERAWRNWVWVRWLLVVAGLVILIAGARMVAAGLQVTDLEASRATKVVKPAKTTATQTNGLAVVTGDKLDRRLETELTRVRAEFMAESVDRSTRMSLGMMLIAVGIAMVGFALTHWDSHLRDGLLCKGIREKLLEETHAA